MRCASSGSNTKLRRTAYLSSLTRATRSMRRTGQPWYGLSGMIGPVVRSLRLTATTSGPHWWFRTQGKGQATSCISRRAWPKGPPRHDCIWHRGPPPYHGALERPPPGHSAMVRQWRRGGRDVPADTGTLPGPSGGGTGPRLLPGANQEHLGCGPGECSLGRGALLGAWDPGDDGTQVSGGVHQRQRGGKSWLK